MGCCGDREKGITVTESQRWDYLTLSDFKSTSCLAPFSYVWLWILVFISGAVYAADAFTAVNLLAFNKWSSDVKPKVSFDVAKWIFAVCIIVSYVFLAYRWFRAIRVIRSGSVTECYLEPLAAIWQSMRLTKTGQGWRRFLVFAELTRSRKGVDYIALFVYFQFKGALIIILAQGPRIAINAMTLWAVMEAQIIPNGKSKDHSAFVQFFLNIEHMAKTGNQRETIIYFTMLFSLVIWVIAALSLLISVLFYIFFLWHHVDKSDGSLTHYCRRKIETRLERIVSKKIKKALEKQDMKRRREEAKGTGKGDAGPRMPTLPKLGGQDDDTTSIYSTNTVTTLPPYSSNASSRTNTMNTMATARAAAMKPTLPSLNERPMPSRSDTQGTDYSTASFGSNAPLLSQAGDMGMASPLPPMPPLDRNADYFNGPPHGATPNGMGGRPYSPMTQGRPSPAPPRAMPPPVDTQIHGRNSPAPSQVNPPYANRRPGAYPLAGPTFSPYNRRGPAMGPSYEMSPVDMTPSDYAPASPQYQPNSPEEYRPPQLPSALRSGSPAQMQGSGQLPRAGTAPPSNPRAGVPATLQAATQRREASQPLPYRGQGMPQQRSATAPLRQPEYRPAPTDRSDTTAPGQGYNSYSGY